MKLWIALGALVVVAATPASAQFNPYGRPNGSSTYGSGSNSQSHTVSPYQTPRGTYVAPHQQTNPNSTQMDNYGSRGNINPYTGQVGTRTPRY